MLRLLLVAALLASGAALVAPPAEAAEVVVYGSCPDPYGSPPTYPCEYLHASANESGVWVAHRYVAPGVQDAPELGVANCRDERGIAAGHPVLCYEV